MTADKAFLPFIDSVTIDLVEYRVKPVTRYIVTRHEKRTDPRFDNPQRSQTAEKGTFDNPVIAFEVAYALAGQEHEQLGWPVGDDRMQYPKGDPRYPETVVGNDEHQAALVKQMTDRFLGWKLPADFSPDGGIDFEKTGRSPAGLYQREPVGTNLFTATQAKAMIEYLLEGLVITAAPVQDDASLKG